MKNVFYSEYFEEHIFEIEYYYRTHESNNRAEKVLKSIANEIDRIVNNPLEFPIETKNQYKGYKKSVVHYTFIIYFLLLGENEILISDIIHGKMNF